jgi:hypothetical protein
MTSNRIYRYAAGAVLLAGSISLSGCNSNAEPVSMTLTNPAPFSVQELQAATKKKVFFGHQSVGYDIVQGVEDVLKENPAFPFRVMESADPQVFAGPVLAHMAVGRNSDPASKINDFAEKIRGGIGDRADVAVLKLCYADIERGTDAARVFAMYKSAITALSTTYPKTRFLHVTTPLKATSNGWKTQINNLLGKPHPFIADNVRRDEYNQLLRKEYAGKEPFFDLAAIQATRADGTGSFDKAEGRSIPSLAVEYTRDSGHLNEVGRKYVARQFLRVLASF